MCMSFHIDLRIFINYIMRVRQMPLTHDISVKFGCSPELSGDMYPKDMISVLAPDRKGGVSVFPMVWGFTHESVSKPIANCRMETAPEKNMWRDSWYKRRCVIPVSWYYEWGVPVSAAEDRSAAEQRIIKKAKYTVQPEGTDKTYLAGLYRFEEHCGMQVPVFSVITREAAGAVQDIHDRMPLILRKEDVLEWIRPGGAPGIIAARAVTGVIVEEAV